MVDEIVLPRRLWGANDHRGGNTLHRPSLVHILLPTFQISLHLTSSHFISLYTITCHPPHHPKPMSRRTSLIVILLLTLILFATLILLLTLILLVTLTVFHFSPNSLDSLLLSRTSSLCLLFIFVTLRSFVIIHFMLFVLSFLLFSFLSILLFFFYCSFVLVFDSKVVKGSNNPLPRSRKKLYHSTLFRFICFSLIAFFIWEVLFVIFYNCHSKKQNMKNRQMEAVLLFSAKMFHFFRIFEILFYHFYI